MFRTIEVVIVPIVAQDFDCLVQQGYSAQLSTLSHESNLRRWIQAHVASVQVDQLLHPGTGVVEHAQHYRIPATLGSTQIGLSENLRKVLFAEIPDTGTRLSPQRNGEDLLALQQALGHFRLYVAEECVQGRKTVILRADRNVPIIGQMIEERLHKGYVDLRERQALQRNAPHIATESEQQGEHIAIRFDGVGAQIALRGEIIRQEAGHEHGEVGWFHDPSHRGMTSPKAALVRTVISGN